jgi:hypothetical protein
MATLPLARCARAVTVGLALSGVMLGNPVLLAHPIAPASATNEIWAFEEPAPPPPPDPAPDTAGPADPGQPPAAPPPHRRHIDGDPIIER